MVGCASSLPSPVAASAWGVASHAAGAQATRAGPPAGGHAGATPTPLCAPQP